MEDFLNPEQVEKLIEAITNISTEVYKTYLIQVYINTISGFVLNMLLLFVIIIAINSFRKFCVDEYKKFMEEYSYRKLSFLDYIFDTDTYGMGLTWIMLLAIITIPLLYFAFNFTNYVTLIVNPNYLVIQTLLGR